MRLVISYTHGDGFTYSCDENLPFIYESAEKLYVDIENLIKARIAYLDKMRQLWAAHSRKFQFEFSNAKAVDADAAWASREAIRALEEPEPKLVCGETELFIAHFMEESRDEPGKWCITMPDIRTVDEWFASSLLFADES